MAENRMMNACAAGGMNKGYVNMCGRRFIKALWSVSRPSVFGKIKTTIKALYRAFMVEFFALDIVEQL